MDRGTEKKGDGFWRRLVASALFTSLLAFIGANLLLVVTRPKIDVSALELPVRSTWEWWRTRSLLSEDTAPDVVLLGSSLVMIPVTMCDAEYLNRSIDAVLHPHIEALEQKLAQALPPDRPRCFNFALPGAMISDDFMVTRALLTEEDAGHKRASNQSRRPRVLVLGLSLRDFIDNGVESASSTPTFQYFKHFFPQSEIEDIASLSLMSRLESYQNRLLYLWNNRLELQALASQRAQEAANKSLGLSPYKDEMPEFLKPKALDVVATGSEAAFQTCITEGAFVTSPGRQYPYKDNTREYKKRFRTANADLFENQCVFLDRLLTLADRNRIQVLIVNMPLTKDNMRLMPSGSYAKYIDRLRQARLKHDFKFVNLNESPNTTYAASDFQDTVHMNPSGARKFINDLASALTSDRSLRAALSGARDRFAATKSKKID